MEDLSLIEHSAMLKSIQSVAFCLLSSFFILTGDLIEVQAGTYRLNRPRTTSSQEASFVQSTLAEILSPEGYALNPLSIDVSEEVAMPPLMTPVIVETPDFAVRSVLFEVEKEGKRYTGMVYLVLAQVQRLETSPLRDRILFNSTAKTFANIYWSAPSTTLLALSLGVQFSLFKAELRPGDLNLFLKK